MDTKRRCVLVLGATGRFGASAVQAFATAGWTVLAQARKPPTALPPGARHIATPVTEVAALARDVGAAHVVAYAINPPYTQWAVEAMPLARAGMDLAQAIGARFLLPGNVYNFGEDMPPLLHEDTPQRPTSRKGRIRVAIENELASRAAGGLHSVVVRAGDFFGSGRGSWLDLVVLRSIRKGRLVYPGPPDVPHAWAYLPDFTRACAAVASLDTLPVFASMHFAGHTLTGAQMLSTIERAADSLGLRPAHGWRHGSMPWPLIRAGGLFVPMLRELAEMSYLWRVPHALDDSALRQAIGEAPRTPLERAMIETLRTLGLDASGR